MDGAGVVDQHVEAVVPGAEVAGEGADGVQVLQVGQPVADGPAAGRFGHLALGPGRPSLVARVHQRQRRIGRNLGAETREPRQAEPRQHAANARRKWPLEKHSTSPFTSRSCSMIRLARTVT